MQKKIYVEGTREVLNDPDIIQRLFRKHDVESVDLILKRAGPRMAVETESDWQIVEMLVNFYSVRFAAEFRGFKSDVIDLRETRGNGGKSKDKEILYLASFPPRLLRMLKIIFPFQQYDKKFMYKFVRKFPTFKVGGS